MRPSLKTTLAIALLVSLGALTITWSTRAKQTDPAPAKQTDYALAKEEAERYYASGSYARAHEIYSKIDKTPLPQAEQRWVEFRIADTLWRGTAATNTVDPTKFEQAQKRLEELIRSIDKEDERDLVWVMAHESLGDFFWTRRDQMNWGGAWPHYQQALDWWAGQRDVDQARDRYLSIVFRAVEPPHPHDYYYYTYYGNYLPLAIFENALKISRSEQDKAHLHFLIAMTMRHTGGDWEMLQGVSEEFEAALAQGKKADWYDDALFFYAASMATQGTIRQTDNGQWIHEPDYVKALELLRRLTTEFRKGETPYYDQAVDQIREITQPTISVTVSNIFLPTSELQFNLSARNLPRADFALYKIDLTRDVRFIQDPDQDEGEGEDGSPTWLKTVQLAGRTPVKVWSENLKEARDHRPISKELRIEGTLPLGAYLLEGKNGKSFARDLVLVTDTSLVLKSSPKQALVYLCNAMAGAPAPNANVVVWESYYQDGKWRWRRHRQTTNKDGLAVFNLSGRSNHRNLFAAASSNERQAFSLGYSYARHAEPHQWRIYAFTDRPAYRPTETVQWKFVARRFGDGVYSTPANEIIEYQINDPRGTKVSEGQAPLNSFGSAWGSLELGAQLPLGEYNIIFWDHGRKNHIGNAKLFRLEEYKLPEFKVAVKTPEENGKRRGFRVGEKVEVGIQADYYFGGPVPNASVEVVVYQNVFFHYWYPKRDYPWYYSDMENQYRHYYGGGGQVVKRETIKTDSSGKATLTFDTPRANYNQDYEYRIEARVTDSSRREIVASNTVRVTRQRYYVYARPQQNIYRPQDKVKVDFKALDANNQPVTTSGTVKITRDYWYEIWIDPTGREVKGEELRKLGTIPPPFTRARQPWRLKFRGYKHDDIATVNVKTDENGSAEVSFIPERDGYYRLEWQSSQQTEKRNRILPPIKTETRVFVATNATTELGYRHSGVEIIVDKDTFRAGQIAPVMLTVPTNDRYVLFSVEGEDLYSYQLVHVTGTAKLIELPIDEKHVPNIFLAAAMVSGAELSVDTKQVVVPPANQFLSVDVKADREQYQPREDGTLSITTRDGNGTPVAAEVALGLIDESVNYIQQDYAGDPRQFYYGAKRAQLIQIQSTFQQKSYAQLVDAGKGQLIDRKNPSEREELESRDGTDEMNYGGRAGRADKDDSVAAALVSQSRRERAYDSVKLRTLQTGAAAESPAATLAPMDVELPEPPVQVRSDFRSTVLWLPDVKTDTNGFATVKVKYPDSLTTWQATARVATAGNQFGLGSTSTRTKQPLIVRLQAPRFFVVGDQVTVSAVINNNTDQAMKVAPSLSAEGLTVSGQAVAGQSLGDRSPVEVKANSETRVDWRVSVTHASEAKIKVQARGDAYADAMEKTFSIYEHGIEKFISRAGKMRGSSVAVSLDIPRERRVDSTVLTVQVAPSMATTMIDALPYLIDYPYGCTEQTMSRFLPAVITAKTLRDLGLKPEAAMQKVFGGIEPSSAGVTHPKGKHDLRELDEMTRKGLERLYEFQHADGGWGWWKDGDSDHFMTAYVVWGMTLAREAGVDVKSDVLARAATFLDQELVEEEKNYDIQSWMLHALAVHHAFAKQSEVSKFQIKAFENLWSSRDRLNAYTRALLALSAHKFGFSDKAKTLVENLENGVKIDSRPDTSIVQSGGQSSDPSVIATAHWGEDGLYWRWSEGGVEATSFALRALLAIDPNNKLIEPVTNWLIKNRRGSQWSNTRDTAIVVLTLNDYLRTTGEVQAQLGYDLLVNGTTVATKQIDAEDALGAPTKFNISRELIKDGGNEITIRRTSGTGPLYFSAQATFFSLEEPVKPAGNEIFVRRQYFKLVNHPTLLKGHVSERVPLSDGETVKSGDRIEVVLTIEGKNNYEYLLFEDLKPAGLEAVQIRSGGNLFVKELKSGAFSGKNAALMNFTAASDFTGRSRWVYQELRDRKVALFIDQLPEGVWQLGYELRAESPGTFHALPVLGHAMYVPEIRTNGGEIKLSVVD
ncbi:MAG TPA: alpha-2-macroglobulin family protein [Pyrinomonadaceae bacterium]|nr:alpha-2-macroglobulin family protein [Pyrinomonadaceae bacterium]